jgi:hypothetical protein
MPVSIRPGQTALIRIPEPESWYDMDCASDTTAALEAEYGVVPAFDLNPATDAVPIILPEADVFSDDVFIIAGAAYLAAKNTLTGHIRTAGDRG